MKGLCCVYRKVFEQSKKREKHPWSGDTFVKLKVEASNFTKNNTLPWVFFTFFKLYKWYQIAQSIAYYFFIQTEGRSLILWRRFFKSTNMHIVFLVSLLKILNELVIPYFHCCHSDFFFKFNSETLTNLWPMLSFYDPNCVKCRHSEFFWSVFSRIRTEYGEISVSHRIQSECGKIRTRKTLNTDTFHEVPGFIQNLKKGLCPLSEPTRYQP